MKVKIVDMPCVGHINLQLFPEDDAEKFFLRLLEKEDPEIFGINSSWEDPRPSDTPECIVSVDTKWLRERKRLEAKLLRDDDVKSVAN